MSRYISVPVRAFAVAALLLAMPVVVAAATGQQAPEPVPVEETGGLISFVPRPDAVFLEKSGADPALGNALAILELSSEEVARLKEATGRSDLLAVGPDDQQVLFRDDGKEGDAAAGDHDFTAIVDVDPEEVADRAEADTATANRGENRVPVFSNRELVGSTTVSPFDLSGYEAGARVELTRALSISPGGTVAEEEAVHQHEGESPLNVTAATHVPGTNQFQDRVLMIRNAAVVQDPARTWNPCTGAGTQMGVWTFGHIMTAMANPSATGIDPGDFVETWLKEWVNGHTINGFPVPARGAMQALINDWHNASPGPKLDLSIAPFRLLAINPRIDLRRTAGGTGGYGGTASGAFLDAGEARFTWGIVLPANFPQSQAQWGLTVPIGNGCQATRFSVITEFRVPKCKCVDVRNWARRWRQLNNFVPGTNAYNGRLERLTRTFTDANRNPARPNRSAIGQVRSNEISLVGITGVWEIREFQLQTMPFSFLLETTTADTPDDSLNNTNTFGNFVIDVANGVAGPSVPLFYPLGSGNNFLGAHPQTPNPATTFWRAPNIPLALNPTRHQVSLGTCNGCHARETNTVFQQIESFQAVPPAVISGFLMGIHVNDPVDGSLHVFDDLAFRETDINAVAHMICAHARPIFPVPIALPPVAVFPVSSNGTEVQAMSAAATSTAQTDPDGAPISIAPEDFLREPVTQVH